MKYFKVECSNMQGASAPNIKTSRGRKIHLNESESLRNALSKLKGCKTRRQLSKFKKQPIVVSGAVNVNLL